MDARWPSGGDQSRSNSGDDRIYFGPPISRRSARRARVAVVVTLVIFVMAILMAGAAIAAALLFKGSDESAAGAEASLDKATATSILVSSAACRGEVSRQNS